jgi:hypothetical protein
LPIGIGVVQIGRVWLNGCWYTARIGIWGATPSCLSQFVQDRKHHAPGIGSTEMALP